MAILVTGAILLMITQMSTLTGSSAAGPVKERRLQARDGTDGGSGDAVLQAAADAEGEPPQQYEQHEEQEAGGAAAADAEEDGSGSAGSAAPGSQASPVSRRFPPDMPFIQALATCDTLECVRDAHAQPRRGARFNFPHAIIAGWQKAATTSTYVHLVRHKHVAKPSAKEPEFFSDGCGFNVTACPPVAVKKYLHTTLNRTAFLDTGGNMMTMEASTHYVRGYDRLAEDLHGIFPWLRLVLMMREPISRAISMLVHVMDKQDRGCMSRSELAYCLLQRSQIGGDPDYPLATNYSAPLAGWLDAFPAGQVLVLQYEEMIASPAAGDAQLRRAKEFLGLNPDIPRSEEVQALPKANMRKNRLGTEGWSMPRRKYEKLIALVRPDAEAVADAVHRHGFGDRDRWMANWEAVWQANLDSCDAEGQCMIVVS